MSTQQEHHEQPFEKRVEIEKADSERRVVTGMCMVPDSADRQGDFERADTIRSLSEDFMERLATGEAQNGVMHTTFDSDDLSHVENRVLDAPEKVNGTEYPRGSWEIGVKIHNDDLWQLIDGDNPVLSGFSIGGYIHDAEEYDAADPPDGVDASTKADGPLREITDATIREVSLVDTPAVPEATAHVAKNADGFAKAAPELRAGVDEATRYLVEERGHGEEPARDLARYLNQAGKDASAESDGWIQRAKSFFTPRGGGSGGQNATPDSSTDEMSDTDSETEKAGRTLSSSNTDRVKALHDIAIDVLNDAGEANNRLRFTDDISTSFDVNEFQSKATSDSPAGESGRDADTDTENTMSDTDTDIEEMLKSIKETQEEQAERMEALESDDDGEEKAEDDDDPVADLAETVESLADQQGQILDRIENAEGQSQQKANADADEDGEVSGLDKLAGGLA